MGIKFLNRFLKEECPNSIKIISMKEFSGKRIVIDISIYLYKFSAEKNLIESIYLMISIFKYYNIIPIFIFDGKPPVEKKKLLLKRMFDKQKAEQEYNLLKENLKTINEEEKREIQTTMDFLRKQFIYIRKEEIEEVKDLIRACGCIYYDAPGEADELCVWMVLEKKAWACLSEDMDMFVYGCPNVLRYISLLNHTCVLYETKGILENLRITQKEFREICVVSGTDYNKQNGLHLYKTLELFKKFRKENKVSTETFYPWLINDQHISKEDAETLQKIFEMFNFSEEKMVGLEKWFNHKSMNPVVKKDLETVLKRHGFIFP